VRIRYPHFVPLGWGVHPLVVLLRAVLALGAAVFGLWLAQDVGNAGLLFVTVLIGVAAVSGVAILWALVDLGSTREVTGQILRLRTHGDDDDKRYYVAVDDGASATIRAWRVKPELYSPLRQYEVVTGTLTRNLRYVRAISQTEPEITAAKVATAPRA
jgi:hypothetical protein